MTTAANMLASQVLGDDDIRASEPAIYRFEVAVVQLGTTQRGKPPKYQVKMSILWFLISFAGLVVLVYGVMLEERGETTISVPRT